MEPRTTGLSVTIGEKLACPGSVDLPPEWTPAPLLNVYQTFYHSEIMCNKFFWNPSLFGVVCSVSYGPCAEKDNLMLRNLVEAATNTIICMNGLEKATAANTRDMHV